MNSVLRGLTCSVLLAAWCREGSLVQQAPPKAAVMKNPLEDDSQALQAGAKLYERECSACHGTDRQGRGKAPPLDRPDIRGAPPGALFWVLRNGSLRTGMPSFASLPEPQRWQIISFLRSAQSR